MAEEVKESHERSCKDVLFLILFVLFEIAFVVCMGIGFREGDPKRLVYPMDFKGQLCGVDEAVKDCKYVAWMDTDGIATGGNDHDICVPACAGESETTPFDYSCYPDNDFAAAYMPSDHEVLRRCIPDDLTESAEKHFNTVAGSSTMADLQNSFGVVVGCIFLSVAVSFVWLELLKRYSSQMIWFSLFVVFAMAAGLLGFLWKKAYENSQYEDFGGDEKKTMFGLAIAMTVVFFVLICAVCWMRNRISMTAEMMEEAAAAVQAMPCLIVFPIIPFIEMVLFFVLWLYAGLYIASAGSVEPEGDERFNPDEKVQKMLGFHVFALIWNLLFIVAVQDTTTAGAVATWYYTRDKSNLGSPITTALGNTLRYNLGSIALGSLLVAIVKIIKFLFDLLKGQAKREAQSTAAKFVANCAGCMVSMFDRFFAFISRNALIHVAIYNTTFCEGAHHSFKVVANNMDKVFAVNTVGDFLLFVCKFTVAVFSGLICMVILDKHYEDEVVNSVVPAVVAAAVSFVVASQFFGTVEMAIDTILICFCHEEERVNDDPNYQPYMSEDLKAFIERHQALTAKVGDEAAA